MRSLEAISAIGLVLVGFVLGTLYSDNKHYNSIDSIDTVKTAKASTYFVDTAVFLERPKIETKLNFHPVKRRVSHTDNVETNSDTTSAPVESEHDTTGLYVSDTVIDGSRVHAESPVPIPLGLFFSLQPPPDTIHLRNRVTDSIFTNTVYIEKKRPWYEVLGYVGIGVVIGTVVGILARGK